MIGAPNKGEPLRRYTEDKQKEVREKILCAAETIVVAQGWEACTFRRVGEAVGQSRGVVNDYFKGTALREALVAGAYSYLLASVRRALATRQSLDEVLTDVVGEVAEDTHVSVLIVQVSALFAAPGGPNGDKLKAEIIRARGRVAYLISRDLVRRGVFGHQDRLATWSIALVAWFEAACAVRVMTPEIPEPGLRRLAYGFEGLLASDFGQDLSREQRLA
jgi:AcrR family transcriptional regulator